MNKINTQEDLNTVDNADEVKNPVVIPGLMTEPVAVDESMAKETGAHQPMPGKAQLDRSLPREAPTVAKEAPAVALINREESDRLRTCWLETQGKFVDEPRAAVQQADALVSEVIAQLTQMFAKEHTLLEGQWKEGKEVSTEDLRQALLRYHSFFKRLVV